MIECVSLMCEMLAILIVIHSLLGRKFVVKVKEIFLLVVSVVIYYLINIYMLPAYIQVMVYLAVLIYLRVEFSEEKIVKVVAAMLCTAFLVCGIQMPIYYLLEIFQFETFNGRIVNVIILICAIIITKTFNLGKIFSYITKVKFGMAYIILICGLLVVFLLFVLKIIGKFSGLEMFLFDVTFLIVIVCFFQWKTQHDTILMKEREIKWLAQCNDSFEQLITDVRSRQHEFNSQINAICGMQYSCTTYEELVQQINLYTDKIIRENRFNRLLTMECPPIIKGFLYYRFCRANEDSIIIDYEIALDSEMDFSIVFDIVEIVGILFDNACETLKIKDCSKNIFVSIKHMEMGIQVLVENVSNYISHEEIALFVKKGYSTKSNERGYGLYNVKNVAKKYNGEIDICNIDRSGENWLRILVDLPFSN